MCYKMKLLILVGLCVHTVYGSKSDGQYELENVRRGSAGRSNYDGFIDRTTYGDSPFNVNGMFKKNEYRNEKDDDGRVEDDIAFSPKFVNDVGYEYLQRDQLVSKYGGDKDKDEYLEYLGYRGPRGFCVGEYNNKYVSENIMQANNSSNYFDNEVKERCDRLFGYTGPTANDEPENLVRPCALDDWQCIRNYFAANSDCKPASGPIPDPLYIDVNTHFYPFVNLTVTLPNLMVTGLSNARVREFYVNKKSGNIVFALNVTNLNETIPRAYFRFHRTAKESIVLADYVIANYRSITITAVIPNVPHLRLDLADIHPDVQDPVPQYSIGPGVVNSTDPDVVSAFVQFNAFIPVSIREVFFNQSPLFVSIYIQKYICDFGLRIFSI